jgi:Ran GTPase-activating protein (RanGAP) involved in mRNA processing and transport
MTGKSALATLRQLPPLSELMLCYCERPTAMLRELASDSHFSSLRHLGLERSGGHYLPLLAESRVLEKLRSLDLYQCGINASSVGELSRSHFRLRSLLLNNNTIGPQGARVIASSAAYQQLDVLGLYNNKLGPDGCEALASSPQLKKLGSLDLRKNSIGQGIEAFAAQEALPALHTLMLVGNKLDAKGLAALCQRRGLRTLNLQHTRLEDDAIEVLVEADAFCRDLRELNLRSNHKLTDESAFRLARCESLQHLRELNVNGTKIGRSGIAALRKSPQLANAVIYAKNKRLTHA